MVLFLSAHKHALAVSSFLDDLPLFWFVPIHPRTRTRTHVHTHPHTHIQTRERTPHHQGVGFRVPPSEGANGDRSALVLLCFSGWVVWVRERGWSVGVGAFQ